MGKLHSQLALFGSIDDEVVRRNDPRTTAIVEKFLPGTTGYGQRGWWRNLRDFIDRLSPTGSVSFPDRDEALRDLANPAHRRQPRVAFDGLTGPFEYYIDTPGRDSDVTIIDPDEFAELTEERAEPPEDDKLLTSTLARAVYAGAVIANIQKPEVVEPSSAPVVGVRWTGGRVILQQPGDALPDDPLSSLFRLATPNLPTRMAIRSGGPGLRRVMYGNPVLNSREGYRAFMKQARFVDPGVANYPPPCTGALRMIDGELCAVLTTELVDENHTLEQLRAVVDPLNWDQALPTFFCAMRPEGIDGATGWSRVLECVSTECSEYVLETPLKYFNGARDDSRANQVDEDWIFVNYDLDPERRRANTLVDVDSGYIWITRHSSGGVLIRTSKALKICGLSPTATAALACFSGWAQVGIDMLINAADSTNQGVIDFQPATRPDLPADPEASSAIVLTSRSSPAQTPPTQPERPEAARIPVLPHGFRQDLAEDTAQQVDRYIEVSTRLSKVFLRRWRNGLTRDDVQEFGDLFGRSMTNLAVGAFDSAMGNFRPKPRQPGIPPDQQNEAGDD